MFIQFCDKYNGCGYDQYHYKLDQLSLSNNSTDNGNDNTSINGTSDDVNVDSFIDKYIALWNDFVSFRINFMYNDLYNSIIKMNNNVVIISMMMIAINYFIQYFWFQRNQFVYLPINGDAQTWYSLFLPSRDNIKSTVDEYKEIINYFSNDNNVNNDINGINPILRYFIIYTMEYLQW